MENVLYTPEFSLKASCLCPSYVIPLTALFNFFADKCIMQDLKSQRIIGLDNQIEGLYRLMNKVDAQTDDSQNSKIKPNTFHISNHTASSAIVNNSCVIPEQALWHFKLGHLSHDKLVKMSQMYHNITSDNKVVSRHKGLPYNFHKFELLHFDVWGRLATGSIHGHKYFLRVLDDFRKYVWIVLLKSKAIACVISQSD